jgi:chromosome segregation ATPase
MIYGDDEVKGDYTVDARGSSALVERDIQNQAIMQMGEMAMNPAFGVDPKKWFGEMCKAQRLDPKRFQAEEGQGQLPPEVQDHIHQLEAQLAEMQEQLQKSGAQVEAAQIRAQAMVQAKQIEAEARLQSKQIDAEIKMQGDQLKQLGAEQLAHIRGQYQKEIEYMRQELDAIDKEIKIADSETRRGQLELQREALMAQLQTHREDMDREVAKLNQGNPEQVLMNNEYGKIPHAIG